MRPWTERLYRFLRPLETLEDRIALADLSAAALAWRSDGGVSFRWAEQQAVAGDTAGTTLALYWAAGPRAEDRLGKPILSRASVGRDGTFGPVTLSRARLGKVPALATNLLLVVDPPLAGRPTGRIAETDEGNNARSINVVDVTAGAVRWNSLAAGGGFTFTYGVANRSGRALPDFDIAFSWAAAGVPEQILPGETALVRRITGANKAAGTHTLTVTHPQLRAGHRSPADGAPYLVMVVDPTSAARPLGAVRESDPANNATALQVVPLVVNVLTHGWGGHGTDAAWQGLKQTLDTMPVADSILDGRVVTYVADWAADEQFAEAAYYLGLAKLYAADAVAHAAFQQLAERTGERSRTVAYAAAEAINQAVQGGFLLPADASNGLQQVQLIGHGRGAAVNAAVSRLLTRDGYRNLAQFTALDGYGTDFGGDGGVIGDFPITSAVAQRKVNYVAQVGFGAAILAQAQAAVWPAAPTLPFDAAAIDAALGDLVAPPRVGFENTVVRQPAGTAVPTDHRNILDRFLQSVTVGSYDPAAQFLYDNVIGWNRFRGSAQPDAARKRGQFVANDAPGTPVAAGPTLPAVTGVLDGSFDRLRALDAAVADFVAASPADAFLDYARQQASAAAFVLSKGWTVEGDARLAGDGAAELTQAPATAVSRPVNLPARAEAVELTVTVVSRGSGGRFQAYHGLDLLLDQAVSQLASGRLVLPLPAAAAASAALTFRLVGPASTPAVLRLDDVLIPTTPNTAPVLTPVFLPLPVAHQVLARANTGLAVADLLKAVIDAEDQGRLGVAVVGANTSRGKVQYSFDGGATWADAGAVGDARALLLPARPGVRVRYQPVGLVNGRVTVADGLTFRAWDRTTGLEYLPGHYGDASTTGDPAAFSQGTQPVQATVHGRFKILWVNRGTSDRLTPAERAVVDRAIAIWERAIRYTPHGTFRLTVVGRTNLSVLGSTGGVYYNESGPFQGTIYLDDNGGQSGWYVDGNPADHREFAAVTTAFSRAGGPGGNDMMTTVLHELGHALGFGGFFVEARLVPQGGSLLYVGGRNRALRAVFADGGHIHDGYRPHDLMTPNQRASERQIPSDVDLAILADAYGYVVQPFTI